MYEFFVAVGPVGTVGNAERFPRAAGIAQRFPQAVSFHRPAARAISRVTVKHLVGFGLPTETPRRPHRDRAEYESNQQEREIKDQ